MALVLPLALIMVLGVIEVGYALLDQHVVLAHCDRDGGQAEGSFHVRHSLGRSRRARCAPRRPGGAPGGAKLFVRVGRSPM